MSSDKKRNLAQARQSLAAKDYKNVVAACKLVLREDKACYEAYVYLGKAAFELGEYEQAELSYQKATNVNQKAAQAWQGLSELYHQTQQWAKAADADQALVDLAHSGDAALAGKLPGLARRLGEAHVAAGQLEEAEVALRDVLAYPMPREDKLPVLALLADVQLKEDYSENEAKAQAKLQQKLQEAGGDTSKVNEEAIRFAVLSEAADEAMELDCDHATPTLKEIVCSVAPTPPYVKYYDTYLRRLRQAVNVAPPGSMDRHNRRVAVLEVSRAMMEGRSAATPDVGMGCASPYAYETALRLLEIEEEIAGACMPRPPSQEFGTGLRAISSHASFSGLASPRSGLATPKTSGLPNPSPVGSFFGNTLQVPGLARLNSVRVGSMSSDNLANASVQSLAGSIGAPIPPPTPKRIMSSARLTELVHNPMAAATAAAGGSMAAQERESLSQLAAEASAAPTANGSYVLQSNTSLTPMGSFVGSLSMTPSLAGSAFATSQAAHAAAAAASAGGGPRGLRVSVPGTGLLSQSSFGDLAAPSPRGTLSTTVTPRPSVTPAASPLLLADREMIGRKLAHAFPWNPTGQVHLALALRRREAYVVSRAATVRLQCNWQGPDVMDLSCSDVAHRFRADRSRQAARRAWLVNLLAKGLAAGAPVVSAMIGLAELRLEAGDATGALDAAKRGIKFVFDRSKIAKERARHAALMLNLLAAQALLAKGDVTDAGRIFVRLAARVSEGEIAFGSDAVGMPATSIRQQAIRGLAQVALAQGDRTQALHHYGEMVSKALMGRGSAEHWAYAEYGWLLFQEGNADAARYQLETALDVLHKSQGGMPGTESIAAGYNFKLARIYWALNGDYKAEREYCHAALLEAAAEEGPQQAEAFEWLGHWYSQVAHDEPRARKCYQRALALDPTLGGSGNALCDLLASRLSTPPSPDAADAAPALEQLLLQEILSRAADAQWARARLARLQLEIGSYTEALTAYQAAIRSSPKSAELWEGLAACYQAMGRHASALKSFNRTIDLDPARAYAQMSAGALEYMAGAYEAAARRYRTALQLVPEHPAALLGLAEVLLSSACKHAAMGAAGAAAIELAEAGCRAEEAVTGAKVSTVPTAAANAQAGSRTPVHGAATAARAGPAVVSNGNIQGSHSDIKYNSNLVTGWKLLGDIRLQQHLLQPAAAAAAARSRKEAAMAVAVDSRVATADAAVSAALQHLADCKGLLLAARRAFAHALMLCPSSGELWGDVALSYSKEAQLLRQLQPHVSSGAAPSGDAALSATKKAAVRVARGGLRLSPASSWLWGVLAAAAATINDPAAAEYAYSRALQLDPKAAALWVQLGRLYSKYGAVELAEQCYEAARGAEPTLVSVWEGMAATAAARGSSAGTAASAAAAEHAVGLGGGPESWLQYATTGLRGNAAHHAGLLLASASKASAHQPLMLPPHAAMALALEARGQYISAVAALQYCLALLQAGLQQGPAGLAALGLAGLDQGADEATHMLQLLQPAGLQASGTAVSPESIVAAIEVALARNICLAGRFAEALQLYQRLESQGVLGSNPLNPDTYSWLSYGFAAQQAGQACLSRRLLEQAVNSASQEVLKLDAVMALLQHHIHQRSLESGFSLLLQHIPKLTASQPILAAACCRAWLTLLVTTVAAQQQDLQQQVEEVMRQWAQGHLEHIDMAWVECELHCIKAASHAASGQKVNGVRQLAHAVHTCPWHLPARLRLADSTLSVHPRLAHAVYNACPVLLPDSNMSTSSSSSVQLHATAAGSSQLNQALAAGEILSAASSRATALSAQVAAAAAAAAGQEVARLQRLLHALPSSPDLWYCLALSALLRAVGDEQAAHFRMAQKCCLVALRRVEQLVAERQQQAQQQQQQQQQQGHGASSRSLIVCSVAELQAVRVRLMVAISECHFHSRLPDCHDAAHQWAMDALASAIAAGGVGTATAHRQVGRMLATEGMIEPAEMAYRQAVTASGGGGDAAGAVLELAKLLAGQGRQQEAAQLLHGIWQEAATALTARGGSRGIAATAGQGQGPHFVEAAALEEAILLANLGQWDAARAAAAAGLQLASAAGDTAPAAAELVVATVALHAAVAAPPETSRNLILEARWAASSAAKSGMALPGTSGTAAAGVGATVLAQVELARGKPEKAFDAMGMSFGAWVDQAVPAQVLIAAGELTGQVTDCAAAVHTAPWLNAAWQCLELAAAAAGNGR